MNRTRFLCVIASLIAVAPFAFASTPTSLPATSSPVAAPAPTPPAGASSQVIPPYTTVKGDTFGSVAKKYGVSAHALRLFNGLKSTHLKPGTKLSIPPALTASSHHGTRKQAALPAVKKPVVLSAKEQRKLALAEALKATDKYRRHSHPVAQPAQDFDLSPSEFASCPTPPAHGSETDLAAAGSDVPVPRSPVQDNEFPEPLAVQGPGLLKVPVTLPSPSVPPPAPAAVETASASRSKATAGSASDGLLASASSPKKSLAGAIADFFGGGTHRTASESGEWGNRFLSETRDLAAHGICYDGSWRPDGESHRWEMDCSNTARYLYQVTAGIQLPRTASDQYYYLHLQDKAWDVPMTAAGFADCNYLRSNLKPGDLLFWENTYRPARQPPITHVMIFLGSDARGRWLMAGSQGSKGFYNRRHSGPDVYVFDPTHAVGGYTTWLGLVAHHGRFVAYGRPLEADVKKLSVATNN